MKLVLWSVRSSLLQKLDTGRGTINAVHRESGAAFQHERIASSFQCDKLVLHFLPESRSWLQTGGCHYKFAFQRCIEHPRRDTAIPEWWFNGSLFLLL